MPPINIADKLGSAGRSTTTILNVPATQWLNQMTPQAQEDGALRAIMEASFDLAPIFLEEIWELSYASYDGSLEDAQDLAGRTWVEIAESGPFPVLGALWYGMKTSGKRKIVAAGAWSVYLWGIEDNWSFLDHLQSGLCGGLGYPPQWPDANDILRTDQRLLLASIFELAAKRQSEACTKNEIRDLAVLVQCLKRPP